MGKLMRSHPRNRGKKDVSELASIKIIIDAGSLEISTEMVGQLGKKPF